MISSVEVIIARISGDDIVNRGYCERGIVLDQEGRNVNSIALVEDDLPFICEGLIDSTSASPGTGFIPIAELSTGEVFILSEDRHY